VSVPADPTSQTLSPTDCLREVEINKLQRAIRRCTAVVDAHPEHPQPRNDRSLLHSLAGNTAEACRDSIAAAKLLTRQPASPAPDPLLVEEIELRRRSCTQLTNPPAAAAPSGAAPAAAPRSNGA